MIGDSTLSPFTVTTFEGKCELVTETKGDPGEDPSGELLVVGVGRCELDCHGFCTGPGFSLCAL